MNKTDVTRRLEGYVKAWKSNNPKDIAKLFTEDAFYSTGPFDEPLDRAASHH